MTVNSLGGIPADGRARTAAWYAPLVPIAISIFAVSALVSYHLRSGTITGARTFAQNLIVGIYEFFGWVPSCMFFGLVLAWSSIWWATGTIEQPGKKLARIGYLTLALAVFGNLDTAGPHTGALGAFLGGGLTAVFGSFLGHLLMAPVTFLCLLLATDYFWMSYFERRAYERALPAAGQGLVGAASAPEAGVEAAVTEEFKELARILPQHAAAAAMPAATAAPHFERTVVDEALDRYFDAPEQSSAASAEARTAFDPAADEPSTDEVDADGEPVRLSYFERRQLRAAREAAANDSLEAAARAAADGAVVESTPVVDEAVEAGVAEALSSPSDSEPIESAADESSPAGDADPVASPAADAEVAFVDMGSASPEATERAVESLAAESSQDQEPERTEAPAAPVLEETALRAALGFEAEASPTAAANDDAEPRAESSYEVRHEPLFPSSAEVVDDLDEDEAEEVEPEVGDAAAAEPEAIEPVQVVLSPQPAAERPRGFLPPVREPEVDDGEVPASASPQYEASAEAEVEEENARDGAEATDEPVVAIPRPPEGPRQQSLFVSTLDEGLVRDALDVLQSNSRATASMLQRRLRIDYEQAKEVLALLAHRGLVDLAEDGSQARRRG